MSCSADAATAGRRDVGAELAGELRDGGDLRKSKQLAELRAGLALQILELRVGGDQPARAVEAAENRPRFGRER